MRSSSVIYVVVVAVFTCGSSVLAQDVVDLVGGWPSADALQYFNDMGEGRQKGIEVSGRWATTSTWKFGLNYSRLWAQTPDGEVAVRRPGHELVLNATWVSTDTKTSLTGSLGDVADLYSITPVGVEKFEISQFWVLLDSIGLMKMCSLLRGSALYSIRPIRKTGGISIQDVRHGLA